MYVTFFDRVYCWILGGEFGSLFCSCLARLDRIYASSHVARVATWAGVAPFLHTRRVNIATKVRRLGLHGPFVPSVAPAYCAQPRNYRRDTRLLQAMGLECLNMAKLGATSLALACALEVRDPPVQEGYLSDTCLIPYKTRPKASLRYYRERVLRDMGGHFVMCRKVYLYSPPERNSGEILGQSTSRHWPMRRNLAKCLAVFRSSISREN